jgi:hypothetical protein
VYNVDYIFNHCFNKERDVGNYVPQINYFFKNPDYYYEYDYDDVSLNLKDPKSGRHLTFFEILTCNMVFDLFVDKIIKSFRIIAVTKDGPNLYLLSDNRCVIQLRLKSQTNA